LAGKGVIIFCFLILKEKKPQLVLIFAFCSDQDKDFAKTSDLTYGCTFQTAGQSFL
jgi:hypothetical protein